MEKAYESGMYMLSESTWPTPSLLSHFECARVGVGGLGKQLVNHNYDSLSVGTIEFKTCRVVADMADKTISNLSTDQTRCQYGLIQLQLYSFAGWRDDGL